MYPLEKYGMHLMWFIIIKFQFLTLAGLILFSAINTNIP